MIHILLVLTAVFTSALLESSQFVKPRSVHIKRTRRTELEPSPEQKAEQERVEEERKKNELDKETRLENAILAEDISGMEAAIKEGVDINEQFKSTKFPLQLAIEEHKNNSFEYLLGKKNIDLELTMNVRLGKISAAKLADLGFGALAAFKNNIFALKQLLQPGASVDEDNAGRTPLMWAAMSPQDTTDAIHFLLNNGANMYKEDYNRRNAAQLNFQMGGNSKNLEALLDGGFDLDKKDSQGISFREFLQKENPAMLLQIQQSLREKVRKEVVADVEIFPSGVCAMVADYVAGSEKKPERVRAEGEPE